MASASVEDTTIGSSGNTTSSVDDRNSSNNGFYSSSSRNEVSETREVDRFGNVEVSDGVVWTLLAPLVLLVVMVVVGAVAFGLWRYKDRRCGPKAGEAARRARDEEEEAGGRLQLQPLPPGEPRPLPDAMLDPSTHHHHPYTTAPCPGLQPQSGHGLLYPYAAQLMHRHAQHPDATGCSSVASRLSDRRAGSEVKEVARPAGRYPQNWDHGQEDSVVFSTTSGTETGRSSQGQAAYRRRPRALGVSAEDIVEEVHCVASSCLAGSEKKLFDGGCGAEMITEGADGQTDQTYCSACQLHCGPNPARSGLHSQSRGAACCCSPYGPDTCPHAVHEGRHVLWPGHVHHVHGHHHLPPPAHAQNNYLQLLTSQRLHQHHYHHKPHSHHHHHHHGQQENQLHNDQFYDVRDHPSPRLYFLPEPQRQILLQGPLVDVGDGRWIASVKGQGMNASLIEQNRSLEGASHEPPVSQSATEDAKRPAQKSNGSVAAACQQGHSTAYSRPRLYHHQHEHGYYVNRAVDIDEEKADTDRNGGNSAGVQQTQFVRGELSSYPSQLPSHCPSPRSCPHYYDHPHLHPHNYHRHPSDGPHPKQLRSDDWQQGGVENPVFVSDMEMVRASEESLLDSDSLARRSGPGGGDGSPGPGVDDTRGLYLYHRRKRTPQIINSTSMQSSFSDDESSGISRRERLLSRPLPPILPKPALGEGPDVSSIKMMSSNSQAWRMSHRLLPQDLSSATPSSDSRSASACGYRGTDSSGSELKDEALSLPSSISRFHASRVQFPPPALDTPYPLCSTKAVYSMHHSADSGSVSGPPRPGSPSPGSLVIELLERFSDSTSMRPNVGSSVTSGQPSDVSRPSDAGGCQPPSTGRPCPLSPEPDASSGEGPARPAGTERGPAARGRVSLHFAAAAARERDYRDLPAREVDLAESAEVSSSVSGLKGGHCFSRDGRPALSDEGKADGHKGEAEDHYLFHGDRDPLPPHPQEAALASAAVQKTKDDFPLTDPLLAVTSPDLPASAVQFRHGASLKRPDYVYQGESTRRHGFIPNSSLPPTTTKLPPATMKPPPGATDQRKSSDYKYTRLPVQDNLQGDHEDDVDEVFLTSAGPDSAQGQSGSLSTGGAVPPAFPTTPRTPLLAKQVEEEGRRMAGMRRLIAPFRRRSSSKGRTQTPFRPSLRGYAEHTEPSNLTTVHPAMTSSHHPSPSANKLSYENRLGAPTAANRIIASTQSSHAQQDDNTSPPPPSPPPPAPDDSNPLPVNPAAAQGHFPSFSATNRAAARSCYHGVLTPSSPSAGNAPALPPLRETDRLAVLDPSSQHGKASTILRNDHVQGQPLETLLKAKTLLPMPRPVLERLGRQETDKRPSPQLNVQQGFHNQRHQRRGRPSQQQRLQCDTAAAGQSPNDQRYQKQSGPGQGQPPTSDRRATDGSEARSRPETSEEPADQQPQQERQPTLARTDSEILAEIMLSFPKAPARKHAAKAVARNGETDSSGNNNTACNTGTRKCGNLDVIGDDSDDDSGSSAWSMVFPDLSIPTSFADELFGIWSLSPELDSKDVSPSQPRLPLMTPLKDEEREANSRFIWGSHRSSLSFRGLADTSPGRAAGGPGGVRVGLRPRALAFPARPWSNKQEVGSEEQERIGSEEQEGVEEFMEEEDGYEDDGFSGLGSLTTAGNTDYYGLDRKGHPPPPPLPPADSPAEDSPEQMMSLTTSSTRSFSDPAAGPAHLASFPGGGGSLQDPAGTPGSRYLYPLGEDAGDDYDDYCALTLNNANLSHLYVISGDLDEDGSDAEPDSLNNNNDNDPSSATVRNAVLPVPGRVTAKAFSNRHNLDSSSLRRDSVPSVLAIVLDKQTPWL